MVKTLLNGFAIGLSLAFAFSLVGCGSSSGGGGTVADGETVTRVANTYDEQCALCHGDGRVADVTVVHDISSNSPVVSIIAVRQVNDVGGVAGDDRLEVDFKIVDSTNPLIPIFIDENDPADYHNVGFTLAKLVPPPSAGDSSYWQNYINFPLGTVTVAFYEWADTDGGAFSALATPGEYRYRFSFNMNEVTHPASGDPITYDTAYTHRIGIEFADNVDNTTVDFVPDALIAAPGQELTAPFPAVAVGRRIVVVDNCNECHVRLAMHGGDFVNPDLCVTCHTAGTSDINGWKADFKVMIHKIHRGGDLPSVLAGGQYLLDFFGRQMDWGGEPGTGEGGVEFPQDIRNCTKCHRNASESNNYKLVPNREACGACHDDVNFDTGLNHPPGAQADNMGCAGCHTPDTGGNVTPEFPAPDGVSVTAIHRIPRWLAGARFKYNILSVTGAGTPAIDGQFVVAPGALPVITFSVQDPTGEDPNTDNGAFVAGNPRTATYNIQTHPAFNPAVGNPTLRVLIGWFTEDPVDGTVVEDYTHTGSTATPAQPIRVDLLAGTVDNGDGTFTAMATVAIPANAKGSAVVAMEGHPAGGALPGVYDEDRAAPTGAVQAVAISDDPAAVPQTRRVVVDAANCNNCHGRLSLHGANRNNNTQLCVLCHNANATDINDRLEDPDISLLDGKREEAIDFKYMIHAIHAGSADEHGFRTKGIVVSDHDEFKYVRLPNGGMNLMNCLGCHIDPPGGSTPPTNTLPINENALPTTINTGANIADPDDDVNITPTAAVCSSCHDGIAPKTHMADNGGVFDFRAFTTTTSGGGGGGDQAALCGPGPVSTQPAGHVSRTDCCSCHSPN